MIAIFMIEVGKKKKWASWKKLNFTQSDRDPVVCVNWNDTQKYIKWLNKKINKNYRLPTESEWEYVARAGSRTKWCFGNSEKDLKNYTWYSENGNKKTHQVGTKKPNSWGVYDMYGNVWEWCEDWRVYNYKNTPRDGTATKNGSKILKILRGGSWLDYSFNSRSSVRDGNSYNYSDSGRGFRLLKTLP